MSDRVAVFNDGRIQQLATPDQLYEEPKTVLSHNLSVKIIL